MAYGVALFATDQIASGQRPDEIDGYLGRMKLGPFSQNGHLFDTEESFFLPRVWGSLQLILTNR